MDDARRPGVAAGGSVGDVVDLARPRAVARVGVVARARRRIPARGACGLESVVVADTCEAGVLVRARRPRVAAGGPVGDVIDLTRTRSIARVGVVARSAR